MMDRETFYTVLDAVYKTVRTLKQTQKDFPEEFAGTPEEELLHNLEALLKEYERNIADNN